MYIVYIISGGERGGKIGKFNFSSISSKYGGNVVSLSFGNGMGMGAFLQIIVLDFLTCSFVYKGRTVAGTFQEFTNSDQNSAIMFLHVTDENVQ